MFRNCLLALLITSSAIAGDKAEIQTLGREYLTLRAHAFPIWATGMGIHDYDSLMTDYSSEAIFKYRSDVSAILDKLRQMNVKKLKGDDLIDHKLLVSNIQLDEFRLASFPYHEYSAALYVEEATNGLYYILIDNSRTMVEKAPFLLSRLAKIPEFLQQKWDYQPYLAKVFYESAMEMADEAVPLVEQVAQILMEAMPDSARRIARHKGNALEAFKNYAMFCRIEKDYARGTHVIGKANFDYLLRHIHFLEIDSDSLVKLGWYWYNRSNAALDSLQKIINSKPADSLELATTNKLLTEDEILTYYQWEINQGADFCRRADIVTVPSDIGACQPVEMPEFMRAIRRGIAYQPPPPFSSDQSGYFYVRPIPPLDSALTVQYNTMIARRGFKGSVVHEAYPGHHLQLSLANRNPSLIRKIQENTLMAEGWALYCEEMATQNGYFDDSDLDRRWVGVYGGIRFRAARVIVDCGLAEGTMTPDSALVLMNSLLGENTPYFTAEIRRYCANPTQASSYLIGKLIILDMLEQARGGEGKSFSLKRFHDKILAEGTIPPTLIAQKLGYRK